MIAKHRRAVRGIGEARVSGALGIQSRGTRRSTLLVCNLPRRSTVVVAIFSAGGIVAGTVLAPRAAVRGAGAAPAVFRTAEVVGTLGAIALHAASIPIICATTRLVADSRDCHQSNRQEYGRESRRLHGKANQSMLVHVICSTRRAASAIYERIAPAFASIFVEGDHHRWHRLFVVRSLSAPGNEAGEGI